MRPVYRGPQDPWRELELTAHPVACVLDAPKRGPRHPLLIARPARDIRPAGSRPLNGDHGDVVEWGFPLAVLIDG